MRVRLTAWHAYPLFDADDPACVGGAETHAWLLANGLSARPKFDVHFVVRSLRRFRQRRFDNVTVWNASDPLDGVREGVARSVAISRDPLRLKLLRWDPRLLWRLPLLTAARLVQGPRPAPGTPSAVYSQSPADVECCFGVSGQSAAAIAAAREAGVPSVLFLESNNDLDARFTPDSTAISVHGERGDVCRRAIDGATRIVAQHEEQQRLLRERFGRESVVWPNIVDLAQWDRLSTEPNPFNDRNNGGYALWVGRADDFHKRPQLCLELARKLPKVWFVMILNPGDDRIDREIRATKPDNVTILDRVPFAWMPAVLASADVYVSTGSKEYEGSPNIFLQAAASRVPVASLDVATPLIAGTGAGIVADGNMDELAGFVARTMADVRAARAAGDIGRRIVEDEHAPHVVVDRLAVLLQELAKGR
ncbi:MAG: glycosyltransferase family 4 protein [Planctomycetaceae bacterium]|nr:glycosyltransferase family 4 protein [Planctomycetaceae bacterium]